ncbi:MAG TPA: asparagine synthase (glutamine-hydrolyzing) [Casimicrobiaceae bacterium]|nr:asparagine synthase (glutamine-hydrolyzing) [Casimicrobiaceae bacterium]
MCGIHGYLRFDGGAAERAPLDAMGAVTVHRGPDDAGMHLDGPCAIGMRRLSIIDVAGGHQPLCSADGKLWLVCNGEIYNYRELRAELIARGHRFATHSDCEVILPLYREMGDAFVQRLNGMFGFALWDAERKRLLVGRDRLGIKPIYTLQDGARFAFASEAKALLALPGVTAALNEDALAGYLHLGYVCAPDSLLRGIRKLPPATLLAVENGKVTEQRYWRVSGAIDSTRDSEDWIAAVRARLEESVRMQMVSDVPIGAFLSGGIDSSAVVGMMSKHSSGPVRTYSIGFGGSAADDYYNELPYARVIARKFATDHHEIVVTPDVVDLLPKLVWHLDEPIADTAFITTYLVSKFAREDVTVILSGVGGDEIFGGYRRYLGDHLHRRFAALPGWLQQLAVRTGRHLPADRHSTLLNIARYAKAFLAAAELPPEQRYAAFLQVHAQAELDNLLVQRRELPDAIGAAFRAAGGNDPLNRMLAVDAETQLPDDLLMLTDRMTMATSLECRVPLLDHELVELTARIPAEVKIKGGELKHLMKRALADLLPTDILQRRKRGFGTPMGAWLKRDLAPVLRGVLSPSTLAARGLFRPEAVRDLIAAHEANRVDGTDRLLALMNLEIWSRVYLDRRAPNDVAAELRELNRKAA